MTSFLIVEDNKSRAFFIEKMIEKAMKKISNSESCTIRVANSYSSAIELVDGYTPQIAIVDHELARNEDIDDEKSGYDVASHLLEKFPKTHVLIYTGHGTDLDGELNVYAKYFDLKGTYGKRIDYYDKGQKLRPGDDHEIEDLIGPICRTMRDQLGQISEEIKELMRLIPSTSDIMKEFLTQLGERIRLRRGIIVLQGDSQSGKSYIAQRIHEVRLKFGWAPENSKFFQTNIGAHQSDNSLISALFGYKKGSFTGAEKDKDGIVQSAKDGTIFLDEIADASDFAQVALLDLLVNGRYQRLGKNEYEESKAFIVLATHKDIHKEAEENRLRIDLYNRLKRYCLYVPSLKERIEDAIPIAQSFIDELNRDNTNNENVNKALSLSETSRMFLISRNSPICKNASYNMAELKGDIEDAYIKALSEGSTQITPTHFVACNNQFEKQRFYKTDTGTKIEKIPPLPGNLNLVVLEKFDHIESLMLEHNSKMKVVGEYFSERYGSRDNHDSTRQAAGQWLKSNEAKNAFDAVPDAKTRWPRIFNWYCQPRVKSKPEICK